MHARTMLAAGAALIAATFYMPAFAVANNKSAYEFQGRLLDVTVTIDGESQDVDISVYVKRHQYRF